MWTAKQIIPNNDPGYNKGNSRFAIYDSDGNAITGWGQVTQSKQTAQFVCDAVNEKLEREKKAKAEVGQ